MGIGGVWGVNTGNADLRRAVGDVYNITPRAPSHQGWSVACLGTG